MKCPSARRQISTVRQSQSQMTKVTTMRSCCFVLVFLTAFCSVNSDATRPWFPLGTRGKRSPFGLNIEHLLNEKRSPYGLQLDSLLDNSKRSPFGFSLDHLTEEEKRSPYGLNLDSLMNEKRSPFGMDMGQLMNEDKRSPFGLEIGSLLGDKRNWEDSERGTDLENEKRSPFRLNRIGALAPAQDKRSPFRLNRIGALAPATDKRTTLLNNQDLAKVMRNFDPDFATAFRIQPAYVVNVLSELTKMMRAERVVQTLAKEIKTPT